MQREHLILCIIRDQNDILFVRFCRQNINDGYDSGKQVILFGRQIRLDILYTNESKGLSWIIKMVKHAFIENYLIHKLFYNASYYHQSRNSIFTKVKVMLARGKDLYFQSKISHVGNVKNIEKIELKKYRGF